MYVLEFLRSSRFIKSMRLLYWQYSNLIGLLRESGIIRASSIDVKVYKLKSSIHGIEKGLTMPKVRLNFGKEHLKVIEYSKSLEIGKELKEYSLNTLSEYDALHENGVNQQSSTCKLQKVLSDKIDFTSFENFAKSRSSVRNFRPEIVPISLVKDCIKIANLAPSSCNRQGVKMRIITKQDDILPRVLSVQGGNRGFTDRIYNLAIITFDLRAVNQIYEGHMPYVDGGYFAMNFTYALLGKGIHAVPLNCNFGRKKAQELRSMLQIPNHEVFVVMKAFGYAREDALVPRSLRFSEGILQ